MQRLRHPIRAIREPFGKAGLTVAILALVLATTGAAFAAAGLNSKQKKEVTKIAKKFAGKPGAPGVNGSNGTPGAKGANGEDGESVAIAQINLGEAQCNELGGAEFTNGTGSAEVCNGETGFTEQLPSGKTETGFWGVGPLAVESGLAGFMALGVSFPIPLGATPEAHFIDTAGKEVILNEGVIEAVPQTACPGNVEEPTAEAGHLCVYELFQSHTEITTSGLATVGKVGALARFFVNGPEPTAYGTWAVTAE